jgi:aspartyl-tRNA(Asn)/glutamyl-tRNA(Gln) amidotransferase subunit B
MRTKEDAHDYRYFPDPDLMPFEPTGSWLAEVRARVVELPLARKQRFMRDYQLPAGDAEVFKNDVPLGAYFEAIARQVANPKAVANWVINNLRAKLAESGNRREEALEEVSNQSSVVSGDQGELPSAATGGTLSSLKFQPQALLDLIALVEAKTISSSAAQQVFGEMFETGQAPSVIVQARGLAQVSDTAAIEAFCEQVIAANPGPAADFKAGKTAALNFLKGQVMKLSKGKANPALAGEILERTLNS